MEFLRSDLTKFPVLHYQGIEYAIWSLDDGLIKNLNYVITPSVKEWRDAILNLAKLINDAFSTDNIRKLAKVLICDNSSYKSLKLLYNCLIALSIDNTVVEDLMEPLFELQDLRSTQGVAHPGKTDIVDTCDHFRGLLERCEKSFSRLAELIITIIV